MKTRIKGLAVFGICLLVLFSSNFVHAQNENIRVDDPNFKSQDLRTGETLTLQGNLIAIIIEGLGVILIILFIIIYAIKKRAKGDVHDKN